VTSFFKLCILSDCHTILILILTLASLSDTYTYMKNKYLHRRFKSGAGDTPPHSSTVGSTVGSRSPIRSTGSAMSSAMNSANTSACNSLSLSPAVSPVRYGGVLIVQSNDDSGCDEDGRHSRLSSHESSKRRGNCSIYN
jgi:hypothetical protein